jgi:hypothetical protein
MMRSLSVHSSLGCLSLVVCLLAAGCSGSSSGSENSVGGSASTGGAAPGDTGGAAATGGKSSTPGSTQATGGESATGGSTGSGGTSQAGGTAATGGSTGTGGTSHAGGTAATGGKSTTGGKSSLGGSGTGGTSSTGGASTTGGKTATGGSSATGGKSTTGGTAAVGGTSAAGGSTAPSKCTSALPAGAQPVDVSSATTVVGTGTAASCTFDKLNAAVTKGGIIKFDCGSAPATIAVTATMNLPTNKDTVIDGGNTITLDGGASVQILRFDHGDFQANNTRVTLQHLTLINGKTTPTEVIPTAPAPCSQGFNDGEGGALYMRDGNLTVIDCTFSNNQAAPLGPDTGGGAIYILGSKNGALIVNSVFTDNSASNAGAVGGLFAELDIYNSLFKNNKATGNGANSNDPSQCDYINNDQNEIGSGGNGGAIYQDGGNATNVVLCGDEIINNAAGTKAFGGGVFMTSNDWSGTMTIKDTTITGNTGGHWTQVQGGSVDDVGTAFGINAKSITVQNSTLQGVN